MLKELLKEMLRDELRPTTIKAPFPSFWQVGQHYHIRSVTMDFAGTLKSIDDKEIVLSNASWVADSGRFNEYLEDTSKVNENEPYKNDVLINRKAITDATTIDKAFEGVK